MIYKLDKDKICSLVDDPRTEVYVFSSIDSTNNFGRDLLAQGAAIPAVVLAEEQTAGRGRRGHSFFSPDSGFYYTYIYRPGDAEKAIRYATICTAVAAAEAIDQWCGIKVSIKWVNDLFYRKRKIAGILCEAPRRPDGELSGIVIGIGINCFAQEFPEELREIAGTLELEDGDRSVLAGILTNRLAYWLNHIGDELLESYRRYSLILGKQVSFQRDDQVYTGIAAEINAEGNLIVECGEKRYLLNSGEISLLSWE
ncbi:MAG: biotin--[Solobacterium sp.]|nr:biotin--[acetyl-CoA-carboxylase] ligase [Solobacterium sp.]